MLDRKWTSPDFQEAKICKGCLCTTRKLRSKVLTTQATLRMMKFAVGFKLQYLEYRLFVVVKEASGTKEESLITS